MSKLSIFSDGGSRGNPGPAAYGFVAFDAYERVVAESSGVLGERTNNFAEYFAFLQALTWAIDSNQSLQIDEFFFFLDSKLVVEQSLGNWEMKSVDLQPLGNAVRGRIAQLQLMNVKVTITHIPRELNTHADSLVNRILDLHQEEAA